jgi:hypothetical protein
MVIAAQREHDAGGPPRSRAHERVAANPRIAWLAMVSNEGAIFTSLLEICPGDRLV